MNQTQSATLAAKLSSSRDSISHPLRVRTEISLLCECIAFGSKGLLITFLLHRDRWHKEPELTVASI
jgi:hypothetical protein